jgi:type IV pilus assembly protein PilY1
VGAGLNWLPAALFAGTLVGAAAVADDTDLFMNPTVLEGGTQAPQVLIVLDNTANWSASAGDGKKFDLEKQALIAFFNGLEQDSFKVGLELFAETGGKGNSNTKGGYIRKAIALMNATNRSAMAGLLAGLDINDDKADAAFFATALHEALLYYSGQDVYIGNKAKADPEAFVTPQTRYRSPVGPDDQCAKKYIVFISNGAPDNGENTKAQGRLTSLGGVRDSDPIRLDPRGREAIWADEYARLLNNQGITTYTIDVMPEDTGLGPDNTALLKSMANQGGGKYFAVTDPNNPAVQLEGILQLIFNEIQSVDTIYAAVGIPIDTNVKGYNLNEIYMGVFRPDPDSQPRWFGNLKLYQIGYDPAADDLFLADATGKTAENPLTGFIASNAVSFWTHASNYWEFSPRGNPQSPSDDPDGEVVEKGGAAQKLRISGYGGTEGSAYAVETRTVYTLDDSQNMTRFSTSNVEITAAKLGLDPTASDADRADLIEWVLGKDNIPERRANEVRPSIHGDVVHSSPATVQYDAGLAVFYGTNAGMLHAIWGGAKATDGGNEIWAFVPPEMYDGLKRLRDNSPAINVPNRMASDESPKTNFVDGPPTVLDLRDDNGDGTVYLYVPMRRGGRFIYAFDITDVTTPRFLWRRGCFQSGTETLCDAGYDELGQAWSPIRPASVDLDGQETQVLFFGAGYDAAAEDRMPAAAADDQIRAQGRGILMVAAETGDPLWVVGPDPACGQDSCTPLEVEGMDFPITGRISLIDTDKVDGKRLADRLYAADTGGNLWVADLRDTDRRNWTVTKLARLGGTDGSARKFLDGPDVVDNSHPMCDSQSAFDYAVLIGSGDREHPLDIEVYRDAFANDSLTPVDNRFYMIKDQLNETRTLPITESDIAEIQFDEFGDMDAATAASLAAKQGWWLPLESQEKVVGTPITLQGSTVFATSLPPARTLDPITCAGNLGTARVYQIRYCDASPIQDFNGDGAADLYATIAGGGLLPPPVPFLVTLPKNGIPTAVSGVILGTQILEVENAGSVQQSQRTYWYKEID